MNIMLRAGVAVALLSVPAAAAYATYARIYYHAGKWDVFDGRTDNGQSFCGMGSIDAGQGRTISIQSDVGSHSIDFRAVRPGWSIPPGTEVSAVMDLGRNERWHVRGVGSGHMVRWSLERDAATAFTERFRRRADLTLGFPNGNEPVWTISLNGSRKAELAFARCVDRLARHSQAIQANADRHQTQPFGRASGPSFAQVPSRQPASPP